MISDAYDISSEPIISAAHFYGEQQTICDICIITFSKIIFKSICSSHDCTKLAEIPCCNGNIPVYSFLHKGKQIAFYLSPIGSAIAGQCVIDANWIIGAKKFIMFGSAGSLDAKKTTGNYVVATHAYRDEGMSYHYICQQAIILLSKMQVK